MNTFSTDQESRLDSNCAVNLSRKADELAHWAKMEGKSESAEEDLLQRVAEHGQERRVSGMEFWGATLVLALCALSSVVALRSLFEGSVATDRASESLAGIEFHLGQ